MRSCKQKSKVGELTKTYIKSNERTSKTKTYYIHDNGSRPFKVDVSNKGIMIYKHNKIIYEKKTYTVYDTGYDQTPLLKLTKFKGYWSGYDSSFYKMHGNSLLIKINDNNYIYIGDSIYSFTTKDKILDYISPVGNNDVPYPVCYGEHYVYFMVEKQYIDKNKITTTLSPKNAEKVYYEFYGINGYNEKLFKNSHKMKTKIIQKRI